MFIISGILFILAIISGIIGFGQENLSSNDYAMYTFFLTTFLSISCFFIHLSDGDLRLNEFFEDQRKENDYDQTDN